MVTALVLPAGVGITIPDFTLANQTTVGILWGLVSALAYAVLSLANRYLSGRYEARTICLYEQGTAAVVLLPALLFLGEMPAPPGTHRRGGDPGGGGLFLPCPVVSRPELNRRRCPRIFCQR